MLPRSVQKTLRLYRNRLWALTGYTDVNHLARQQPSKSESSYFRLGYIFGYSSPTSDQQNEIYHRHHAPRRRRTGGGGTKRRHGGRVISAGTSVSSPTVLLTALTLFCIASLAANVLLPPEARSKLWRVFGADKGSAWQRRGGEKRHVFNSTSIQHAVKSVHKAVQASQVNVTKNGLSSIAVGEKVQDAATAHIVPPTVPNRVMQASTTTSSYQYQTQQVTYQQSPKISGDGTSSSNESPGDAYTRTCYTNPSTRNAVCVHVPLCMRHSSMVYLSDVLRCAAYTNSDNRDVTMSQSRCLELERYVEVAAQMLPTERKKQAWLEDLQQRDSVLWFEGDTVLLRLSYRCTSIVHFAARVFMLHHILQHPQRYGLHKVKNVVVAAHESVAKKIKYSKSWHHGLLQAVVHPHTLLYTHAALQSALSSQRGNVADDKMTVYVSDGLWGVAKSRKVPCFRRVAVGASSQTALFLTAETYPGIVSSSGGRTVSEEARTFDADALRGLVFASLGARPPAMKRRVVYLHRGSMRTFSALGLTTFQVTLRTLCEARSFSFQLVDVSGLSFTQQVLAVGDAGIVVGVHGTQMLNGLFVARGAALLEVMPYGFSNDLMADGSGAMRWYRSYGVASGLEFSGLSKFGGDIAKCRRQNADCRRWYQSDDRAIDFGVTDSAAVGKLLGEAMDHVAKMVPKS